ncbi:hypothetical protein ILYODFUR_009406 [Ilyodon furcidens]|uniref:SWIM-type domain-containing protein n=1 Tax=Ilyodon furcidens TaxID=33524 RepID=A0ABV0VCI1_9TELE
MSSAQYSQCLWSGDGSGLQEVTDLLGWTSQCTCPMYNPHLCSEVRKSIRGPEVGHLIRVLPSSCGEIPGVNGGKTHPFWPGNTTGSKVLVSRTLL